MKGSGNGINFVESDVALKKILYSKCFSCCKSSGLRSLQASVALLAMTSTFDSFTTDHWGTFWGWGSDVVYRRPNVMHENNVEIWITMSFRNVATSAFWRYRYVIVAVPSFDAMLRLPFGKACRRRNYLNGRNRRHKAVMRMWLSEKDKDILKCIVWRDGMHDIEINRNIEN